MDLTLEYQAAVDSRKDDYKMIAQGAKPVGREPDDIASEYEAIIRALLG